MVAFLRERSARTGFVTDACKGLPAKEVTGACKVGAAENFCAVSCVVFFEDMGSRHRSSETVVVVVVVVFYSILLCRS